MRAGAVALRKQAPRSSFSRATLGTLFGLLALAVTGLHGCVGGYYAGPPLPYGEPVYGEQDVLVAPAVEAYVAADTADVYLFGSAYYTEIDGYFWRVGAPPVGFPGHIHRMPFGVNPYRIHPRPPRGWAPAFGHLPYWERGIARPSPRGGVPFGGLPNGARPAPFAQPGGHVSPNGNPFGFGAPLGRGDGQGPARGMPRPAQTPFGFGAPAPQGRAPAPFGGGQPRQAPPSFQMPAPHQQPRAPSFFGGGGGRGPAPAGGGFRAPSRPAAPRMSAPRPHMPAPGGHGFGR